MARLSAKAKDNLPDNVPQAIAWYERAERFPSPYTRSTKAYVLNQAIPALYTLVEQGNKEDAATLFLFAEKGLQELQRQEPLEVQHGLLLGHIYFAGAELFQEQEVLGKAERVWEEALLKSPERQEFQYWLALAKFRLGKFQEALSLLEGIVSASEDTRKGWMLLLCVNQETTVFKETMERAQEHIGEEGLSGQGKEVMALLVEPPCHRKLN